MDKKTKMLLGVGAVAVVGYLVYKQMNQPKGFMNASGTVFAPQESGRIFANATAGRALPCNGGDGGGGANDLCCRGTVQPNGKFKCCAGGEATGTRFLKCQSAPTTLETTSKGGIVTGKARLNQFGY